MASWRCCLVLFIALIAGSASGRVLHQSETGVTWEEGSTTVSERQKCGTIGQQCCVTLAQDGSSTLTAFCADDTLYCQSFPPDARLTNGSSDSSNVTLLSYTGPPSLCLPKPASCGGAGQPCCPLTGNSTDASLRCTAANSICLTDQDMASNLTGLLTADDYHRLQADPHADLSVDAQRSVWGTCTVFQPSNCGKPKGFCGPRLPAPAPQCPDDVQGCGNGFYCEPQQGQLQDFGLCKAVPKDAGKLGGQCLPPGNYSDGTVAATPFCNDTRFLAQFDVYCHAPLGDWNSSQCLRLPRSPEDCGATGKACCPSSYHIVTDRPLPPVCQEGSYCGPPSTGADPVCIANPPGAGQPGKQCLASSTRGTTTYSCDEGSYCDGGLEAEEQGLMPAGLLCKPCGSALDVPLAYQSVCGIGVLDPAVPPGDASSGNSSNSSSVIDPATVGSTKPSSSGAVTTAAGGVVQVETQACEHCMKLRRLLRLLS